MTEAKKQLDARVKIIAGPAAGLFGRIALLNAAAWSADVRLDDGRTAKDIPLKHCEAIAEEVISDRQKLLDRVRKIWAKAESLRAMGPEHEAEAMTFAANAQKMLAKYKLSLSDLEMSQLERDEPIGEGWVPGSKRAREGWVEDLATVVSHAHYCRILVVRGSDSIVIVGRETDRKIAEYVFTTLRRFADDVSDKEGRRFRKQQRRTVGHTSGEARNFRAAWLAGFVQRVAERYREERKQQEIEAKSTGTSLIRLDNAGAQVQGYVNQKYRGAGGPPPRRRQSANRAGYDAGRAAGDRAAIRGTGIEQGSRASRGTLGSGN